MLSDNHLEFLDGKLSVETAALLDFAHFSDEDSVILSGTIVEGIGNEYSDLDIYVICDNRPRFAQFRSKQHQMIQNDRLLECSLDDEEVMRTLDYYQNSTIHIEVEYISRDMIDDMKRRISDVYADLLNHADVTSVKQISEKYEMLFHRLLVGKVIYGDYDVGHDLDVALLNKFCYIAHREIFQKYWFFQDIIGAFNSGELIGAVELARKYLVNEIKSLNYLNGVTNKRSKWTLKYFEKHFLGTEPKLYDLVLSCLYGSMLTDKNKQDYIFSILDALDVIQIKMRASLNRCHEFVSPKRMLELLDEEAVARSGSDNVLFQHEMVFRRNLYIAAPKTHRQLFSYC